MGLDAFLDWTAKIFVVGIVLMIVVAAVGGVVTIGNAIVSGATMYESAVTGGASEARTPVYLVEKVGLIGTNEGAPNVSLFVRTVTGVIPILFCAVAAAWAIKMVLGWLS